MHDPRSIHDQMVESLTAAEYTDAGPSRKLGRLGGPPALVVELGVDAGVGQRRPGRLDIRLVGDQGGEWRELVERDRGVEEERQGADRAQLDVASPAADRRPAHL